MSPIARTIAAGAALFAMATAGVAVAQNYSLNPTYGTLNLSAGFRPDPQVVNLQSGGSVNAQTLSSSCRGFIANAPDVRLNYSAGQYQLMISADASADTTLVINGPDGSWYCDDDGGNNGMNPLIRFNSPASGQYDIWVGTYGNASLQPAQLYISEIGTR
ncbi:MAG TPA: peptidase S1 [Candidatus Binatia bacterium]|nr:peptidase S1 [Candidatus Binatia bacterium]